MNGDPFREKLAAGVAALATGDLAAAQALLQSVLTAGPHPVAFYLLGRVHADRGAWPEAEGLYRRALAISPGQPQVLIDLAHALRALIRPAEAVDLCRQALAAAPHDTAGELELGKALEECGDVAGAETVYRRMLAHGGEPQEHRRAALTNLCAILGRSGRAGEAEAMLRRAQTEAKDDAARASLAHALGLALKLQRRPAEALMAMQRARGLLPERRDWALDRANMLRHLGRADEAAEVYDTLLERAPLDLEVHRLRGEMQGGDTLSSYDKAMARAPDAVSLPLAKGNMLLKLGRCDEAAQMFRRALALAGDHPAALTGLGQALEAAGEQDQARAAHAKSVTLAPDVGEALEGCAGFLLRQEQTREAEAHAYRAHQARPGSQSALALLGLCWRALGDAREDWLNDYQGHVRIFDLAPPEGHADMDSFNRQLSAYLEPLHGEAQEYFTQTLRGGTQLHDDVFHNGHVLVDALQPRIDEAVRRYAMELKEDAAHPFTRRRGRGFRYAGSWSSRLTDRGFHVNHVHQQGWISSCYYVAVPEASGDSIAQQGWLKFGEPSQDYGARFAARRTIQPRPGRLVLFPSFMWHGTVPFHSEEPRITIAFDAVPG